MRRLVVAGGLFAALAIAAPARADVAPPSEQHHGEQAGHEGKPEPMQRLDEHGNWVANEPEEEGIVNWWSWDYGATAQDPAHHGWPPPFGWALVNFLVFVGILSRILWRPLKAGWIARHDQIKGELSEARRLREAAEAQLAEYGRKVANADREVDALLTELRKEAEQDRARIVAAAEAEAKRLKIEADRQIKVEIERAREELRRQAITAAVAAAEEILRKNVSGADQQRLADRYLTEIDQVAPRKGGVA